MIKPLCLITNKQTTTEDLTSPPPRKRADSLVFSITSQKFFSPKETMLMESKQHEVSKELETLQLKLQNLESRVERIDSDQFQDNFLLPQTHKRYDTNVYVQTEKESTTLGNENRCSNTSKAGKIVKRDKDLNKTTKFEKTQKIKSKIHPFAAHSRHSLLSDESELVVKIKQLSLLKKEVSAMKQSMERTQRSKSLCSERLSASKEAIRSLKKQQKKHSKLIERLRSDLKKSQNIREKQKQVILKQQEELNYYRQLFKTQKKIR